jgi:tRNA(fMet)-specific endonuclease VapC
MNQKYLLDTDVLVAYLRGYTETVDLLKAFARNGAAFSLSVVTVVEIESGVRSSEKAKTRELLDNLEIHPLDASTAYLAGSFLRQHRQKGVSLSLADVVIAATAVAKDLILFTYNQRHYPMPEIRLYKR